MGGGTGYLEPDNVVQRIVYDWTKTQEGGMFTQLDCGALCIGLATNEAKW